MTHIMVDIESLGTKPGKVILSIGAVAFDPHGDGPLKDVPTFYQNIDLFSSLMLGFEIDKGTLDWWRGQSEDAQDAICSPQPERPHNVMRQFNEWVGNLAGPIDITRYWAKSPSFDCALMEAYYHKLNIVTPWIYNQPRDVRTICDADLIAPAPVPGPPPMPIPKIERVGTYHNALDDCLHQIKEVQAAVKRLNGNG